MCRLAGTVNIDAGIIIEMAEHQKKGGPDYTGFWSDGKVCLAHNRLSIVDLSPSGNQPMQVGRWVIVFNGEIYNHMDVRQRMEPMQWNSHSDTLTLLNAIEHKGLEWALNNIEGMYSFAAYDTYEKRIYLITDPFGIKPMFYHHCGERFAFASSPAALTYLKPKWNLSMSQLSNMLALGATKEPLFEGMHRLPSGSVLEYDVEYNAIQVRKYYELDHKELSDKEVLEAVKKSVQDTRMSDVPVHIFLSGGIDSTTIASQMPNVGAVHLDSPELEYAERVAMKYGNKLLRVSPVDFDADECLHDYSRQSGDCSAAAIVPYMVSKEVSKIGKVAISANGADELFFGYNRMRSSSQHQYNHIFRRGIYSEWRRHDEFTHPSLMELYTYVEYDLNKTLDFASMCHGIEVRVPFLNRSVVESALGIKDHGVKRILKEFLRSEGFDTTFVTRPKLGFSLFKQPKGYDELKKRGVNHLKEMGISPTLSTGRDTNYFEAAAAAFYCWHNVWKERL